MVLTWDQRFLGNEEEASETRQSRKQESKGWTALKALIPVIIFQILPENGVISDGISRKALARYRFKNRAAWRRGSLDTAGKDFGLQGCQYQSSIRGLHLLEFDRAFAWWTLCRIMDVSQPKYRPRRS